MCVRGTGELTSMTDGIFGLGTMQGESQDKSVAFSSVFQVVRVTVRVGSRDCI
jgi:hypothetical protein